MSKYTDSGIATVADFDDAERAVREAFRWFCCDPNADQKGCAAACPRRRSLEALDEGRALLLRAAPADAPASALPGEQQGCGLEKWRAIRSTD